MPIQETGPDSIGYRQKPLNSSRSIAIAIVTIIVATAILISLTVKNKDSSNEWQTIADILAAAGTFAAIVVGLIQFKHAQEEQIVRENKNIYYSLYENASKVHAWVVQRKVQDKHTTSNIHKDDTKDSVEVEVKNAYAILIDNRTNTIIHNIRVTVWWPYATHISRCYAPSKPNDDDNPWSILPPGMWIVRPHTDFPWGFPQRVENPQKDGWQLTALSTKSPSLDRSVLALEFNDTSNNKWRRVYSQRFNPRTADSSDPEIRDYINGYLQQDSSPQPDPSHQPGLHLISAQDSRIEAYESGGSQGKE